ncbi:hypothetical protein GVX82_03060 [Patescibacteria group bacterium]|jgi:hypothetical protein|nr:hypothetical protein [Patescibacteria group bacterium]
MVAAYGYGFKPVISTRFDSTFSTSNSLVEAGGSSLVEFDPRGGVEFEAMSFERQEFKLYEERTSFAFDLYETPWGGSLSVTTFGWETFSLEGFRETVDATSISLDPFGGSVVVDESSSVEALSIESTIGRAQQIVYEDPFGNRVETLDFMVETETFDFAAFDRETVVAVEDPFGGGFTATESVTGQMVTESVEVQALQMASWQGADGSLFQSADWFAGETTTSQSWMTAERSLVYDEGALPPPPPPPPFIGAAGGSGSEPDEVFYDIA